MSSYCRTVCCLHKCVCLVQIASSEYGQWHTSAAVSMRCSLANPEMWGLTIDIPKTKSHFAYKYVAIDSDGVLWIDPGTPRVIDLRRCNTDSEIEQEDIFDRGVQSSRDTYLFSKSI